MSVLPRSFFPLAVLFLCLISAAYAENPAVNLDDEGFAIQGYDPVAYFDGKVDKGSADLQVEHGGMKFQFSTINNQQRFIDSPNSYLPAYGGYCAYGIRMGSKLDIDPEAYEIRDGKLYVLLNRATLKIWQQDRDRNIEIADKLWPSIKNIPADEFE